MDNHGHGFVFVPTAPDHWVMGSGKATARFGAQSLMPDGHGWKKYRPTPEYQNKNNFESMACTVFASLNAWETLAKYHGFNDFPTNCSDRFSAIMAGVTPNGCDPHEACEAIRNFGVIAEEVLPFSENIYDWPQFYSPDPMTLELISLARQIKNKFDAGHEWIFNGPAADKPSLLKAALARGTVSLSVFAWRQNLSGLYYKFPGDKDQHWVELLDYEDGKWWLIGDQYAPFEKKVAWDTDFTSAKLHFLSPKEQVNVNLQKLRDLCQDTVYFLTKLVKERLKQPS